MIGGDGGFQPTEAEPPESNRPKEATCQKLELTDLRLQELFSRTLLGLEPDNFFLYVPARVLRVGRHSVTYQAVSRVDQSLKMVSVYNKQQISVDNLTERAMKDVFYFRKINPERAQFYTDEQFYFSVEPYREAWTLRHFLASRRRPSEAHTRFLVYGTLLELDRLHSQGLVHLNLTPSAIALTETGFPFLRKFKFVHQFSPKFPDDDFEWIQERKSNWVIVAPELVEGEFPGPPADFYALGILLYSLIVRNIPGIPTSLKECVSFLAGGQLKVNKNQIPHGWSLESVDLINRLIIKSKELRLGTFGGVKEVLAHAFFHNYREQFAWNLKNQSSPLLAAEEDNSELLDAMDEDEDDEARPDEPTVPQNKLGEFLTGLEPLDQQAAAEFDRFQCLFNN